jgi:hypothetical protein
MASQLQNMLFGNMEDPLKSLFNWYTECTARQLVGAGVSGQGNGTGRVMYVAVEMAENLNTVLRLRS